MVVAYLRRLSSIVLACLARRVLYVAHRLVCGAFGLVDALVSSEPDIEEALNRGGWKAAAVILYRDHLLEAGLDPTELQGKDLSCTCKLTDPCHADVLIELANA